MNKEKNRSFVTVVCIILGGLGLVSFNTSEDLTNEKGMLERLRDLEKNDEKYKHSHIEAGTIVAFSGDKPPEGWKLCNGKELKISKYPDLYEILKDGRFGNPVTKSTFVLPNLQGYFLRGADRTQKVDVDFVGRTGGGGVFKVGSLQLDDLKSHKHAYIAPNNKTGNPNAARDTSGSRSTRRQYWRGGSKKTATLITGGKETRPKNIAVNYIIKL